MNPEQATLGNLFTIIIGPNGSGKSRLLADIAERTKLASDFESAVPHLRPPTAVLAVSNMVHDRFPMSSQKRPGYSYLGVRQSSNMLTSGVWADQINSSIARLMLDDGRDFDLTPTMELLSLSTAGSMRIAKVPRAKEHLRFAVDRASRFERISLPSDKVVVIEELLNELPAAKRKDRGYIEGMPDWQDLETLRLVAMRHSLDPLELLNTCIEHKLVYLRQVFLKNLAPVLASDLSTGEQLVLANVARVLSRIERSSLILIDEPEMGLHPAWQSSFIPLLEATLPSYYGCHFILATHSPHIVVEGTGLVVPGARHGEFRPFEGDVEGRSIEDVLYRAFEARTPRNHQVERDLAFLIKSISSATLMRNKRHEVDAAMSRLNGIAASDTPVVNSILAEAQKAISNPE